MSASAKTMLGFLPPSSRATFFTVRGGRGHEPAAGLHAAGERDQVDARVARPAGAPASGPAPSTRLPTPAGSPASSRSRIRWMRGVGGELAGLEHEGVAGGQAGRDLPRGLQQRVVPGGDQPADADRLVHDPADDVGVAGVDDAAGVLGGDAAVVAEDRGHVGDVVPALDQALAGVLRLGQRDLLGVALEEVGGAQQEVAALAGGRRGPGAVVEGAVRRGDREVGVGRGRPRRPRRRACRRRGSGSRVGLRPRRPPRPRPRRAQASAAPSPLLATDELRDLQPIAHAATIRMNGG